MPHEKKNQFHLLFHVFACRSRPTARHHYPIIFGTSIAHHHLKIKYRGWAQTALGRGIYIRTQRLEQSTEPGGEGGIGTWRRRAAEEFLLREMTQSCEGAMKSLRSDACSAGENLLDDMAGRAAPTGSGACGVVPLRLRDDRNQSALPSLRTSGGAPAKPYSRYAAAASLRK